MNKRDRAILKDLERFRVMDRDSIGELHFKGLKNPHDSANKVLKRLHRDGYIQRNTNAMPYLYFPGDNKMKRDSQKINHFLKILETYKDMCKYDKPSIFMVEPKYGPKGTVEPDAFTIFRRTPIFLEIQCTRYTDEVMTKKMQRYVELYQNGTLQNETWQPEKKVFPRVLILSENRYPISNDYPFKVLQAQSVEQFLNSLKKPKQQQSQGFQNNTSTNIEFKG